MINDLLSNVGDMALKRRIIRIIEELEISPEDKVLDCGCGDGFCLKILSELGKKNIIGVDLDKKILSFFKSRVSNIFIANSDIYHLPFRSEYFDKIYSFEVLEHIEDDEMALEEMYRVLKPGGKLVVTVPNSSYPFLWDPLNWIIGRLTGRHLNTGIWVGHLRLYNSKEIISMIEKAGFKIKLVQYLTYYCFPFNHQILSMFKRILFSGVLPKDIQTTGDKFSNKEKNQSNFVKFCYKILGFIDKLNDKFPNYKVSASILVAATKSFK